MLASIQRRQLYQQTRNALFVVLVFGLRLAVQQHAQIHAEQDFIACPVLKLRA